MSSFDPSEVINKPMPRCPCCGKEWPPGMKPLTYGEWFEALGKAITEAGNKDPETPAELMVLARRAAVIARESHVRKCEVLGGAD